MSRLWIAIGIGVFPLLAFVGKTGAGPIRWIPRPGPHALLEFFEHLAGNDGLPLLLLYAAACVAAILPVKFGLLRMQEDFSVWRVQFLLVWLFFPLALTLMLSIARPLFVARYFIFCSPPLILLAAAGLADLRKAWMATVCLAVMLGLSFQGTLAYYDHDFDLERDGSEAAANFIFSHAQPGDAVVFHIAEARIPYEFFLSQQSASGPSSDPIASPEIVFPRHGVSLDYRDVTGNPTGEFLRSLSERYARVWVVLMSNGSPGHPDPTTLTLNRTLSEVFPRLENNDFPQVEVRLYSKP